MEGKVGDGAGGICMTFGVAADGGRSFVSHVYADGMVFPPLVGRMVHYMGGGVDLEQKNAPPKSAGLADDK